MTHAIRIVDVFTDRPFTGNQLAVVLNADDISGETMQDVAREMNFSETTFVLTPQARSSAARVRIFTPAAELPFAGHPTVGTAWVLWKEGLLKKGADRFTLEEGVGPVSVRFEEIPLPPAGEGQGGGSNVLVWMTHPTVRFQEVHEDRAQVARALGLTEEGREDRAKGDGAQRAEEHVGERADGVDADEVRLGRPEPGPQEKGERCQQQVVAEDVQHHGEVQRGGGTSPQREHRGPVVGSGRGGDNRQAQRSRGDGGHRADDGGEPGQALKAAVGDGGHQAQRARRSAVRPA
ncbi:MAG TPA: PhzF family phenazine biosynthesis isomerase [Candidatus Dormibacteraeota bacterium]